jgi:ABC-type nitrate/sulfonate/bicarbonate transport system substrate-binding protein
VDTVTELPDKGKDLVIVAVVDRILHFRAFDGEGRRILETTEYQLEGKARPIAAELRRRLEGLWPPHDLTESEKEEVIGLVDAIIDRRRRRPSLAIAVGLGAVAAVAVVALALYRWWPSPSPRGGDHGLTTVRFGMLPYGDHTYAIIGMEKGWFEEVGIRLDYQVIQPDQAIAFLKNGSLDIASGNPGLCFAAYQTMPGVGVFAVGSIFQGYAIMAQPGGNYRSYDELVAGGMKPPEAVQAAVAQLRGKVFAYPSEAAVKPFIDLVLEKGKLSRSEFKSLVLDDALTVNAMRNKQADFQMGGAPSRLVLQREGFKPILSSRDLAAAAKPSPDSRELSVLFPDGWMTTAEYFESHRDVILRLASVNFRIMRFMNDHRQEALELHMPFLSRVTGQSFTPVEGAIIYDSLDPFYTFEAQKAWYHDPESIYYYQNLNGAILNSFIAQGIYSQRKPTVEDAVYAAGVYVGLEGLQKEADILFAWIESSGITGRDERAASRLAEARKFYKAYNYLDAARLARKIAASAGLVSEAAGGSHPDRWGR